MVTNLRNQLRKMFKNEKGQGLVEYALIVVLISLVAIAMLILAGAEVNTIFSKVVSGLKTA